MKYSDRFGQDISSRKWLELFRDPEYSIIDSFTLGDYGADLSWVGVWLPFVEKVATPFLVRAWEVQYSVTDGIPSGRSGMTYHWFTDEEKAAEYIGKLRSEALARLEEDHEDHQAAA